MSEIRRRKQRGKTTEAKFKTKDADVNDGVRLEPETSKKCNPLWFYFNVLLGACCALYIGYRYAGYMKQLHENDMWFSNIQASFACFFLSGFFVTVLNNYWLGLLQLFSSFFTISSLEPSDC